jgi:hypothetical protein
LDEEADDDDDAFEEDIFELKSYTGRNNFHRKKSADPQLEALMANDEDFR